MPSYYAIDELILRDGTASITGGRCKPAQGSRIITFKRTEDDLMFLSRARVASADYDDPDGRRKGPGLLTLGDITSLDGDRPLSGLAGSLQKTRHFLEPERHFKQSVVSLPEQDYRTLISGQIAWARSLFRMIFHALPLELRAEFVRLNPTLFPQSEGRNQNFDYPPLAITLLTFFEERFDAGFELLQMVVDTFPVGIEGVPDISELYLAPGELPESQGRELIPLGTMTQELLVFGRENFTTSGLRSLKRSSSEGQGPETQVLDSNFIAQATDILANVDQTEVGRKWLDSIF